MQNEVKPIPIDSNGEFFENGLKESIEAKQVQATFIHEWEDFCDNLEETLNMPEIPAHIFNRFEDEYEKLWNKWQYFLQFQLGDKKLSVSDKETYNILKVCLEEINQSYLNFDPEFINSVRQTIKSQKAVYKEQRPKNKGLFLVK